MMRFGSLCSGIEAASVAWEPLGWKAAFFAEIDKFPARVLSHYYPATPNHGDMTKFKEWPEHAIDLLVGGTPCQSFSVAGLRKGLDDPRGNLALTYLAICERYKPRWVVWENVPGVLSSISHNAPDISPPPPPVDMEQDGQEMETEDDYSGEEIHALNSFLAGLSELGYGWSLRVLDAQYWGVAQRRRRVFVVGYLGDWRPAAAVLFEQQSLFGHPPPSRKTGQGVAPPPGEGTGGGGEGVAGTLGARTCRSTGAQDAEVGHLLPVKKWPADIASTLNAAFGDKQGLEDQHINEGAPLFVPIISRSQAARYDGSPCDDRGPEILAVPAYGIPGNWIGRAPENGGNAVEPMADVAPCLTKTDRHGVSYAIQAGATRENPQSGPDGVGVQADHAYTLEARAEVQAVAVFDPNQITSKTNGSVPMPELCHTLPAEAKAPITFPANMSGTQRGAGYDLAAAIRTGGESAVAFGGGEQPDSLAPWAPQGLRVQSSDGTAPTLMSNPNGGMKLEPVMQAMQVRRLTPKECERLQGFPDDYTLIPGAADGPRYKALGNSMAVPVMRWIGERIQMVDDILKEIA
jgi:DNA (cytosine-5)-methyltransferase 1